MGMRKKLRTRRGVTLSEMLVAMAVLGLVTAAIATGMTAGVRIYQESTDLSQTQVLLSTLTQSVSDELRYARDITTSGGGVVYTSPAYGPGASLVANGDGQVAVAAGSKVTSLLGSGSYGGYRAGIGVTYADGCFEVTLDVKRQDGQGLQHQVFAVRALNPKS